MDLAYLSVRTEFITQSEHTTYIYVFWSLMVSQTSLVRERSDRPEWTMPRYMYPSDQPFPDYTNGPAYLMSRQAARCLMYGEIMIYPLNSSYYNLFCKYCVEGFCVEFVCKVAPQNFKAGVTNGQGKRIAKYNLRKCFCN